MKYSKYNIWREVSSRIRCSFKEHYEPCLGKNHPKCKKGHLNWACEICGFQCRCGKVHFNPQAHSAQ